MAAMKWWGWGQEGVEFSHEDKPGLAPFIAHAIGVDVGRKGRGAGAVRSAADPGSIAAGCDRVRVSAARYSERD